MPYGGETLTFRVPTRNLIGCFAPHMLPTAEGAERGSMDAAQEVARAMAAPVAAPTLVELAHGARRVIIVADDGTRLTPTDMIIPLLLEALNAAGVPDACIEVLIALGTHREMAPAEIEAKFGPEVTRRVAITNHEAFSPHALVDLGCTPSGVSAQISRRLLGADLVLGVGSIVPHHIAGFSGGAKIVQPGVCGERTTGEVHLLSVRRERTLLGVLENPVREEMEIIAQRAGLRAILNTVLDSHGHLVAAVYGHPQRAFRWGAGVAQQIYGVAIPTLADIVIAGSSPCDSEFWQAHKTLYPAQLCCRQGGTLIIVTPCPEGVAATHPDICDLAGQPSDEIDRAIRAGEVADLTGGALALAWASVRRHASVYMISRGISAQESRALGFHPFDALEEALASALSRHGADARITVLPYAPDTLPVVAQ
jgi:nickel-dependent lactate racemase